MTAPSVEQYRTLREADQIAETITVLDARLAENLTTPWLKGNEPSTYQDLTTSRGSCRRTLSGDTRSR